MKTYDTHKTETEVRQSDHSHMNFRVLVWSGAVLAVVFGAIYLAFFLAA